MTKRDYIIRQIAKTNKKNYENYVVTRIYHLLNRTDLKFITQQYVNRPDGHALTDMYLPQLQLHIEIDESFHKKHASYEKTHQFQYVIVIVVNTYLSKHDRLDDSHIAVL